MAEHGYLIISDITGYTAFLSQSELEHAEDSLRSLISAVLEESRPPLIVSKLEGDAIFSYAPAGSFLQGQTLVEAIESTYCAFRQARERMRLNTTCTCMACRNIPNLDLKFFVHYGEYMIQQLGAHTELLGSDVTLVHRLLKNHVTEALGFQAYTLYSEAAIDALDLREFCGVLHPHRESYEHLGEVETFIQDLHPVWQREREKRRVVVTPEEAILVMEQDLPVGLALAWDYLTKPETRAVFQMADSMSIANPTDGRTAAGSVYVCAHGKQVVNMPIVDWQPLDHFTIELGSLPFGGKCLVTSRLEPREDGTRCQMLTGPITGGLAARLLLSAIMPGMARKSQRDGFKLLSEMIEADIAAGRVVVAGSPGSQKGNPHETVALPV